MAVKKIFNIENMNSDKDIRHWGKTNEIINSVKSLGFENGTDITNISNQKSGTFIVSTLNNNVEVPVKNVVTTDGDQVITGNKTFKGITTFDNNVIMNKDLTVTNLYGKGNDKTEIGNLDKILDKYGVQRKFDGMDGEAIYHNGNDLFPQFILNEGWVCDTEEDLQKCLDHKPSFLDVLNSWPRFRIWNGKNYRDTDNLKEMGVQTGDERKPMWKFDEERNTIQQPTNSTEYVGFISPRKYSDFDITVRVYSTSADDDFIGLVAGYYVDKNKVPHTLSFLRGGGGVTYTWACIVDYCSDVKVLVNKSEKAMNPVTGTRSASTQPYIYNVPNSSDINDRVYTETTNEDGTIKKTYPTYAIGSFYWNGHGTKDSFKFTQEDWNRGYYVIPDGTYQGKYINGLQTSYPYGCVDWDMRGGSVIRMIREGNKFTAYCSQFNSTTIDPNTKIEVDLDQLSLTNPILEGFKESSQWGYSSYSQAESMYENINIVDVTDYIYDLVNWDVLEYKNGEWKIVPQADPLDTLGRGRFSYNNITNKTFFTNSNSFVYLQAPSQKIDDSLIHQEQLVPTGMIIPWPHENKIPNGYLSCNGQTLSVKNYQPLYNILGTKYGGDGIEYFKLPNLNEAQRFIQGNETAGIVKEAGLPNIKGTFSGVGQSYDGSGATLSESFYIVNEANRPEKGVTISNNGEKDDVFGFDASRSNPIYGKSNTVQPPALTMIYIIKY